MQLVDSGQHPMLQGTMLCPAQGQALSTSKTPGVRALTTQCQETGLPLTPAPRAGPAISCMEASEGHDVHPWLDTFGAGSVQSVPKSLASGTQPGSLQPLLALQSTERWNKVLGGAAWSPQSQQDKDLQGFRMVDSSQGRGGTAHSCGMKGTAGANPQRLESSRRAAGKQVGVAGSGAGLHSCWKQASDPTPG
jgi:hypothetical protein